MNHIAAFDVSEVIDDSSGNQVKKLLGEDMRVVCCLTGNGLKNVGRN